MPCTRMGLSGPLDIKPHPPDAKFSKVDGSKKYTGQMSPRNRGVLGGPSGKPYLAFL